MIWYRCLFWLGIGYLSELHLIWLRVRSPRLEVQNFLYIPPGEDVMTAANPFVEAELGQEPPKVAEGDSGIRRTPQDP